MGYFLNIICENLDNLSAEHYIDNKIPTEEERYQYVSNILLSSGLKNIRKSYVDDNAEHVNENFYYWVGICWKCNL